MKIFKSNPDRVSLASLALGVTYACPDGHELKMHIIHPQKTSEKHPLIVFVQGSGWTKPNYTYEIPQLSQFARAGYVVATIDHRHASEAPGKLAFLEDTKSAIRFLRANAAQYGIDPERVAIWGTSSGGNTALLVGMTYDMPEFDVGDNLDQSSKVSLVVDTFGPSDMVERVKRIYTDRNNYMKNQFSDLANGFPPDNIAIFEKMSPIYYVGKGKELPPTLILNGDSDPAVSYEGALKLYDAMVAAGYDVDFVKVEGGEHEGGFWSKDVFDYILAYIEVKLK
jgi:acetyl esterase/lipase